MIGTILDLVSLIRQDTPLCDVHGHSAFAVAHGERT